MKIRQDFGGCVYVAGHRLVAGDKVPEGAKVSGWLLDKSEAVSEDPVDQYPAKNAAKAELLDFAEYKGLIEEDPDPADYTVKELWDRIEPLKQP